MRWFAYLALHLITVTLLWLLVYLLTRHWWVALVCLVAYAVGAMVRGRS